MKNKGFLKAIFYFSRKNLNLKGKGQNVKNQNIESQKEHRKFEKDQNIKSQIRLSTF